MRITVDIEEGKITELMALTGEKMKSPAVARAVEMYIKHARAKEFGSLIREGHFDYPATNDEIEAATDRD